MPVKHMAFRVADLSFFCRSINFTPRTIEVCRWELPVEHWILKIDAHSNIGSFMKGRVCS